MSYKSDPLGLLSFKDFLNDQSVKIFQFNLQILSTETFNNNAGLNPEIMSEIFSFSKHHFNFRKTNKTGMLVQ